MFFLDFSGERHPSVVHNFRPHELKTVSIIQLLADLSATPSQVPEGGIMIIQRDLQPTLIAQGKVLDPATGFSTTLSFPDPARERSNSLHASGVPIGSPTKDSPFAQMGYFVPHVVVRNMAGTPQTVTITVEYPRGSTWNSAEAPGGSSVPSKSVIIGPKSASPSPIPADLTGQFTLAPVSIAPYTTLDYSLDSIMGQVPIPMPYCSIRIQYSGAPGSAIAQVSSVEMKSDMVIDATVANEGDGWRGSGANPWHLDNETESIVFLTDASDKPARIGFSVTADGVHYYLTTLKLAPHETRAIDLRKLRDAQQPDFKKNVIPAGTTDGSVNWIRLDNVSVSGRLVVVQRQSGMTSSYDCCYCACPPSYSECDISPEPPSCIGPHALMQLCCIAWYEDCNNNYTIIDVTDSAIWASDNGAVFMMDTQTAGLVHGSGQGSAHVTASFTDTVYTSNGGTSCSSNPGTYSYSSPISVTNSGVPDHLQVQSDTLLYLTCAIGLVAQRNIKYDIEDANEVNLLNLSIDEAFSGVTSNTCGNGSPSPNPVTCTPVGSSFTDGLTVHCNTTGGSCGFTLGIQQWHWCSSSSYAEVAVGTLYNDVVHNDAVTVLGKTVPPETNEIPIGTDIFP